MTKQTDNMPILTREQAYEARLTKYWNGKNCRRGHASPRYTTSGACCQCIGLYRTYMPSRSAERQDPLSAMVGARAFVVYVHPDDRPAVLDFVGALAIARGFDVSVQPTAASAEDRKAWLAGRVALIHGRIADDQKS